LGGNRKKEQKSFPAEQGEKGQVKVTSPRAKGRDPRPLKKKDRGLIPRQKNEKPCIARGAWVLLSAKKRGVRTLKWKERKGCASSKDGGLHCFEKGEKALDLKERNEKRAKRKGRRLSSVKRPSVANPRRKKGV